MSNLAFVSFCRARIGLPLLRGVDTRCPLMAGAAQCTRFMDRDGIHASACNRYGVKHARHEAVKYSLAGLTSGLREPAETHFQNAQGGDIRGDILTEDMLGTRHATVLDVSIVEDRGLSGQAPLKCWSDRHCATRLRERAKIAKYRAVCEQHGYLFRPMVYSSLGSLGFTSRKGLRLLAGAVCPVRGSSCRCQPRHGTVESRLRFRNWIVRLAAAFWRGTSWLVTKVTRRWLEGARRRGWIAQV